MKTIIFILAFVIIIQAGYFDLSSGCRSCNCNLGGSENSVCDQNSPVAQCPCKPNVDSVRCTTPSSGYFFKQLDSILFEAEDASFPTVCCFCVPTAFVK